MANTVGVSYQSKFYNNIILAGNTTSENPAIGELGYDSVNNVIKYGNTKNEWVTLGSGSSTSTMHAMTETVTVPSAGGEVNFFSGDNTIPYLLITGTATFNIQSWKIDSNNATLIEPDLTIIENGDGTTSVKAVFGEGNVVVRMCLIWSAAGTENGTVVNGKIIEQNVAINNTAE